TPWGTLPPAGTTASPWPSWRASACDRESALESRRMATVKRLSIAPVRGLGLEHPDSVELGPTGVLEDRRFYLTDDQGRLLDRLRLGRLVQVAAHTDAGGRRLRLAFPDGRVVEGDVTDLGEAVETFVYNRIAIGHVVNGPWADA